MLTELAGVSFVGGFRAGFPSLVIKGVVLGSDGQGIAKCRVLLMAGRLSRSSLKASSQTGMLAEAATW
jgi:hypothetical protein